MEKFKLIFAFWEVALAAVTVVLAVFTIVVAVGAIFGYTFLRQKAEEAARTTAEKKMTEFLAESNVRDIIRAHVAEQANLLYGEMDASPTHDLTSLKEKKDD